MGHGVSLGNTVLTLFPVKQESFQAQLQAYKLKKKKKEDSEVKIDHSWLARRLEAKVKSVV